MPVRLEPERVIDPEAARCAALSFVTRRAGFEPFQRTSGEWMHRADSLRQRAATVAKGGRCDITQTAPRSLIRAARIRAMKRPEVSSLPYG
jgi:hypothetical protein